MTFFKKSDIIIITIIIVIALSFGAVYKKAQSSTPAQAEIYYGSTLVETIDLETGEERNFSILQEENVVFHLSKDGSIQFLESDCPDKVCMKAGKLSLVGESAACLPHEIILKIVPKGDRDKDDLDMIVGTRVN